MPKINPEFGPNWIATNRKGQEVACHTKEDAKLFESGKIRAKEVKRRNLEIEASW